MGRAPGLGPLVQMASGQEETFLRLENQKEMLGVGQGARIVNFGDNGVRAGRNNFSFGTPEENGRFWAGCLDGKLW